MYPCVPPCPCTRRDITVKDEIPPGLAFGQRGQFCGAIKALSTLKNLISPQKKYFSSSSQHSFRSTRGGTQEKGGVVSIPGKKKKQQKKTSISNQQFSFTLNHFQSKVDASGQDVFQDGILGGIFPPRTRTDLIWHQHHFTFPPEFTWQLWWRPFSSTVRQLELLVSIEMDWDGLVVRIIKSKFVSTKKKHH